ncbi:MAG: GerMN domain-containing protein [Acetobacteraceae bacterium]|nr:GerMN domain-containing protein [Acetobacteraceae bacterium]
MNRRSTRPAGRPWDRAWVRSLAWAAVAVTLLGCLGATISGCPRPGAEATPQQRSELKRVTQERDRLREEVASLRRELEDLRSAAGEATIALYFVKSTSNELYLTPELRRVRRQPDMLSAALKELIKGPSQGSDLGPVLPKNTVVRSVKVENGIAYPDFSQEVTRLNVGSRGEALSVAAITNTLTKFPEVERVKILVEGKTVETLAGHVDVTQPLARNDTVVVL